MIKILLVEDSDNTRKLLAKILSKNNYYVLQAKDGLKALDILDKQIVDLVIVDIMMPNMNGYDLTQELRAFMKDIPILMITAKQEPADKRKGFIVGTDDYMTKPVDEEEMLLRIRALLRRSQISSNHKIYIGEIQLDEKTQTVVRKNERVELPPKEFQLLFKLLSYPNVIFTRLQLMDEIWGMETTTDDHTLNVHVNRLRERFRNWHEFEIVTVRGLGYKAVRKE
ncbi:MULTISPECIES: response regulator transcription factor [Bacillus]|uniref:response regulator transcription factor n=1 Tax=Bacillus TaxID=1386 RepID=UPI0011BFA148|nr:MULTISPECIES: response regulator transcription factor [Bacillus]MCI4128736.1 response regulator transcription factor [Bacillus haynesii]TWK91873.1 Heme response regulator HssR [Bacillus paralicheniformis]WMW45994.1 response regulator transcription factor [Bacillus paralicheniformis]